MPKTKFKQRPKIKTPAQFSLALRKQKTQLMRKRILKRVKAEQSAKQIMADLNISRSTVNNALMNLAREQGIYYCDINTLLKGNNALAKKGNITPEQKQINKQVIHVEGFVESQLNGLVYLLSRGIIDGKTYRAESVVLQSKLNTAIAKANKAGPSEFEKIISDFKTELNKRKLATLVKSTRAQLNQQRAGVEQSIKPRVSKPVVKKVSKPAKKAPRQPVKNEFIVPSKKGTLVAERQARKIERELTSFRNRLLSGPEQKHARVLEKRKKILIDYMHGKLSNDHTDAELFKQI